MYDLVIVGSGPAGLSAASHALDNGLNYILLERTDHLSMGENQVALPVVGVFEIDNGKIRAWRDYFDMGQFTGAGS